MVKQKVRYVMPQLIQYKLYFSLKKKLFTNIQGANTMVIVACRIIEDIYLVLSMQIKLKLKQSTRILTVGGIGAAGSIGGSARLQ